MNVGIIGLGLIGGSLGRTIKRQNMGRVFGRDLSEETMRKAKLLGVYDEVLDENNACKIDLLIVAVYPKAIKSVLEKFAPLLRVGAVVCDAVGNKRQVCSEMARVAEIFPNLNFVGGHPMAGKEFSGVRHSSATLFDRASMLLVPVAIKIEKLSLLKKFFLDLGFGEVVLTTAPLHDEIISYTSQLAHIISASYILSPTAKRRKGFSAGSFRDLTRVAKMNEEMWSELMLENKDNLLSEIDELVGNLGQFKKALQEENEQDLKALIVKSTENKNFVDKQK